MARLAESFPLDPSAVSELNGILDGCGLASFATDPSSRLVVVTLNSKIQPEGSRQGVLRPLVLALHPVGRIAASYHVVARPAGAADGDQGEASPIELSDIDQVIATFSNPWIDDWEFIDPPANVRFAWRDELSLDVGWGDDRAHFLELWQDDGPSHGLNIGVWFDQLYLFDAELRSVGGPELFQWRQRYKDELRRAAARTGSSWVTTPNTRLQISPADVLERIEGASAI
jgi:hypothetical protein